MGEEDMQWRTHLWWADIHMIFVCPAGCVLGRRTGKFWGILFFGFFLFLAVRDVILHTKSGQYNFHC